MQLNLNLLCRLCMADSDVHLLSIFDDESDKLEKFPVALALRIQECLQMEVHRDDALPKLICHKCLYNVNIFYTFKETCLKSTSKIKEIIQGIKEVLTSRLISKENEPCDAQVEEERPILVFTTHGPSLEETPVDPLALPDIICIDESVNMEQLSLTETNASTGKLSIHNVTEEGFFSNYQIQDSSSLLPCKRAPNEKNDFSKNSITSISGIQIIGHNETLKESLTKDSQSRGESPNNIQKANEVETIYSLVTHIEGMTENVDEELKCSLCAKVFTVKCSLKRHLLIHSKTRPYACKICDRAFSDKSNLIKHERLHVQTQPSFCRYCKRTFTNNVYLRKHLKIVHEVNCKARKQKYKMNSATSLERHECGQCSRKFSTISKLDMHLHEHVQENVDNPIVCRLCLKTFSDTNSLELHKTSFHGEPKYPCELCSEGFMLKKKYEKHMKVAHESQPYKCKMCFKSFSSEYVCREHAMKRHGSRVSRAAKIPAEFQCELCGEVFDNMYSLVIHKEQCNIVINGYEDEIKIG